MKSRVCQTNGRKETMSQKKRTLTVVSLAVALVMVLAAGSVTVLAATLTPYEVESLMFVREEEKLARDTYLTLYDYWSMDIHATIAQSEQSHMDAILGLIEKYNLEDPAFPEIGVFQDDFLQEKYYELTAWGALSPADALLVGCLIEEIDLIDLIERMEQIDKRDILTVFQNLVDGSENHLRAFVAQYESLTGNKYTPVLLDKTTYQQVINGSSDSGGNGGDNGQNGNGGGNGGPRGGR
jgi:hypothetical protein